MRCVALILAASFLATPAASGPDRASLSVGSKHIGGEGFNEINPGLFLTWEGDYVDWSAGVYKNSYSKTSVALTGAVPIFNWSDGEISFFAGIAHYPEDGRNFAMSVGDVVPLGGLQVRLGDTFFQVMPMDGNPVDAVVTFGLTVPLSKWER